MTPDQICRNCTFWRPRDNTRLGGTENLGECGRWRHEVSGNFDKSTVPANGVVTEYDEGWGALMGPEFGCVLWERGTQPEPGSQ